VKNILNIKTKTCIDRERENLKFDIHPINDFITENNRKKFGHICDKCKMKWKCFKWGNSIIIKCLNFISKINIR
jgi:hypothetical protein